MSPVIRFARFNLVGALGVGVQLIVVGALAHGFGVEPVLATAAGVCAAVVHNFGWHVRWTWRDRMGPGVSRGAAFVRFVGANGAVSLTGSVLLMPILTGAAGLPAIPANLVTIVLSGLLNYWLAGRCLGAGRNFAKKLRPAPNSKSPAPCAPERRPSAVRA